MTLNIVARSTKATPNVHALGAKLYRFPLPSQSGQPATSVDQSVVFTTAFTFAAPLGSSAPVDPDKLMVSFAQAANSFAKAGTRNEYGNVGPLSWGDEVKHLSRYRDAPYGDKKQCEVFVAGELAGGSRGAKAVKNVCMFVLDVDSGGTIAESETALRLMGLEGVISPTISYGKTTTFVNADDYGKWAQKCGLATTHTTENVKRYLVDKGKLLPSIAADCTVATELEHTNEGVAIRVGHAALQKHRIVVPLTKRIEVLSFVKGATTHQGVIAAWATAYKRVAAALGVTFDAACADLARMYYWPSAYDDAQADKLRA